MSDIVERLRYYAECGIEDCAAAADEIERLRIEIEAMVARGGDRARRSCPRCANPDAPLPIIRCMCCGTAYLEDQP